MADDSQMQFNFEAPLLPPVEEMPLNTQAPKTLQLVREDFRQSQSYSIITGFSSLEFLLSFFAEMPNNGGKKVQVVLGHEDLRASQVQKIPKAKLSQEIMDYWLEHRISVENCGAALHLISLIEAGVVEFRILQRLHAKIYVGDGHAILGSSNFSWSGLKYQKEGNIRVAREQSRYGDIRQVADYYYKEATPFNEKIIELLRQLLNKVTWQEALARSAALLIEGDWWKEFREMEATLGEFQLWPSQEQAIGRALYILDNHGSLLIADPTGSGKTRMGAALHLALVHRLWASGRSHLVNELLLSPPRVMDNWQNEYLQARSNFSSILSHGTLSSGGKEKLEEALQRLRNAHILMIDEAHNFLNKLSNRSQEIAKSLAEHIILFTATPINRKREDLFRIIELLDIDNFPDDIINLYRRFAFKKKELRGSELHQFKQVLHHFVVRRTKAELNAMINRAPQHYRNRLGNPCKYPKQLEQAYGLNEGPEDIKIAEEINKIAGQLVGITRLQKFKPVNARWMNPKEQQDYIDMRLKSSAALARYMVQEMMRSSTAALIEHLYGSEVAAKEFGLAQLPANKDTGNIIQGIQDVMNKLPECALHDVELPVWLENQDAYRQVCQEEIERYEAIGRLARQLSRKREEEKAQKLVSLSQKHKLLVAFDHHVISLHYFAKLLKGKPLKTLLVTGSGNTKAILHKARKVFGLASQEKGYLGLFSDSMSEGVNLQGASAIVFLDMPSVVRLAEQRIGRIDRMDSPHSAIEIYWPDDHEAFALKTDHRFFKTAEDVDKLIGSNFRIPNKLFSEQTGKVSAIRGKEAINLRREAVEEEEKEMQELLPDAFQSVENLVFGEHAIIEQALYEKLQHSQARVFANVSIVDSTASWAFFALEGAANYAPRWLFISPQMEVVTDLPAICGQLRHWLAQSKNTSEWDEHVSAIFQQFIDKLQSSQVEQLPPKKKRAIQVLEHLLSSYMKDKSLSFERRQLIKELQQMLTPGGVAEDLEVDYDQLGKKLIRFFQPMLQEMRLQAPRRVITLNNLKKTYRSAPLEDADLKELLDSVSFIRLASRRVVACIVGVGREEKDPGKPEH